MKFYVLAILIAIALLVVTPTLAHDPFLVKKMIGATLMHRIRSLKLIFPMLIMDILMKTMWMFSS
ncbi:MAG: hypothetical protein R3E39_16700 [Anaerolineae bacterium]